MLKCFLEQISNGLVFFGHVITMITRFLAVAVAVVLAMVVALVALSLPWITAYAILWLAENFGMMIPNFWLVWLVLGFLVMLVFHLFRKN